MNRHMIALILTGTGVAVAVFSCIAAVIAREILARLHFATPVTSLAAPLIGLGLCVQSGVGLTAATVLLVTAILMLSGPALSAAVGRVAGERAGLLPPKEPQ